MRVWVVSGLLVAVVVGAYLAATSEDPPRREGDPPPAPVRPLTEAEIRTYLKVWPKVDQVLQDVARSVASGNPVAQGAAQGAVDAVFAEHHLNRTSWQSLSQRVRYIVERIRWDNGAEERNRELDRKIAEKERFLESATEKGRELLEKDLAALRKARDFEPPPLPAKELALVKSFWVDLDRAVPVTGAPRIKDSATDSRPPGK